MPDLNNKKKIKNPQHRDSNSVTNGRRTKIGPDGLPNRSCKEQAATLFEHQCQDLHKMEQKG
jgi:hypothetical protein